MFAVVVSPPSKLIETRRNTLPILSHVTQNEQPLSKSASKVGQNAAKIIDTNFDDNYHRSLSQLLATLKDMFDVDTSRAAHASTVKHRLDAGDRAMLQGIASRVKNYL